MGKQVINAILAAIIGIDFDVRADNQNSAEFATIFRCENDEAIINKHTNEPGSYQLVIKNNDINMYLALGYSANPEGQGQPSDDDGRFVGFTHVATFAAIERDSPSFRTAHIFPEYGGLKVLVETAAHFCCLYQPLFGDVSGSPHCVVFPSGFTCPNLYPSYALLGTGAGVDHVTWKDWFFQNCHDVN
jgi:hypothetical protein